jgi:hypothetical protein
MTGPHWGSGESAYDPHEEPHYYTADEGEIVLAHEGELELEQRSDESMPPFFDLGGGIYLRINREWFRKLMHTPEITAEVDRRCEAIATAANGIAVKEGAEYVYQVSNNENNIRARGRVKPGNEAARIDDDLNSTLLKALGTVGSDPLPAQYFSGDDVYERYLTQHDEFHSELAETGGQSQGMEEYLDQLAIEE